MALLTPQQTDGFWSRFEMRDGHLMWTGSVFKDTGYGLYSVWVQHPRPKTVTFRVHRLAWTLRHGPIPDGLHVLHECDIPLCGLDAHHFLGTHQQNMADRDAKGRQAQGERVNTAKLTREQVMEIRNRSAVSNRVLAEEFGVSDVTIGHIKRGLTWRCI